MQKTFVTHWNGTRLEQLYDVPSLLKYTESVRAMAPDGVWHVFFSDTQGEGTLPYGASLSSPNGGLYVTFLHSAPKIKPSAKGMVSQVTALTLVQLLKEYGVTNAGIGWKNDVVVPVGKVGDISVRGYQPNGDRVSTHADEDAKEINTIVISVILYANVAAEGHISMRSLTQSSYNLTELRERFSNALRDALYLFYAIGFEPLFKSEVQANTQWIGRGVCIGQGATGKDSAVGGEFKSLDSKGCAVLSTADGETSVVCTGTIFEGACNN